MILQFALILSFLTAGPAAVLACVNAMRVDGDDAVKQIAQAERLLARGELAKAGRLVDIHDYRFVDSGLQARAALVFHTVALRERGTEKYRLTRAGEFIAEALEKKSDDPVLVSRHAEV
ncbi:MAG: hypothetical protein GY811_01215, partial [Myxococcales bacterium]|nr:hypothetical protein [Myxococcales bacterium]